MEQKNQIQIKDFYLYYLSKCTKGCLDEGVFTIQFYSFWRFIQSNKHLEHIPILNPDGTSYWLIEEDIIKRIVENKNK